MQKGKAALTSINFKHKKRVREVAGHLKDALTFKSSSWLENSWEYRTTSVTHWSVSTGDKIACFLSYDSLDLAVRIHNGEQQQAHVGGRSAVAGGKEGEGKEPYGEQE